MTDGLTEDCGGTQSLVPFSMSHGADECKIKHSMMLKFNGVRLCGVS